MMAPLVNALVISALVLWLAGDRLPTRARWPLALVTAGVALMPGPWGVAHWLPSYTGQFSLVTGLLAADVLGRRLVSGGWLPPAHRHRLGWVLLLVAVLFYPLSMGFTALDPYSLGYGDFRFSTALLLLGLYAWIGRDYALCLLLVMAQIGWRLAWLPSDNLWDYLLDPWLVGWAVVWLRRPPASDSGAHRQG